MTAIKLPVLSEQVGLRRYAEEIRKFPVLEAGEEFMLAKRFQEHGDVSAAHRLVTSHLRLVYKIAMGYRGYGLPVTDLISEGNIGLMQAVKKFDPDRGFRLSTYAIWWIKAAIQEFVLRSWSLVKIGTSAAQKRLFFNLKRIKNHITDADNGVLKPEHITDIANTLQVSESEVVEMDKRISYGGDQYLNRTIAGDSEDEFIDLIADSAASQEEALSDSQEYGQKQKLLASAMAKLNDRERAILVSRKLQEEPATLEELSQKHGISKERVRQIEVKAMEKIQKEMVAAS